MIFLPGVFSVGLIGAGCNAAVTGAPSNPTQVTVTMTPTSASVFLGATETFAATVTGSTNTSVTWEVNGTAGGAATTGTISTSGVYTAPQAMPSNAATTITAVSGADSAASASATVTLKDGIVVTVSPTPVTVPAGGGQLFTATIAANGSPATGVTWSVNGIAGGNTTVGTITANGAMTAVYTAPATPPTPATVTVTATSAADSTKSGSATVSVSCTATDEITPSAANVELGNTQSFGASFCLASGATIVWDVNGIAGGNASVGTIGSSGATTATYTAPANLQTSSTVTIDATASAVTSAAATASATVTLKDDIVVTVAPTPVTVPEDGAQLFTATIAASGNPAAGVTWSVNGIAGGNTTVGTIAANGAITAVYTAPATPPNPATVTVTATSVADSTKSGSASVTISCTATVGITPRAANVGLGSTQSFSASFCLASGATIEWDVNGIAGGNSSVGTIVSSGVATATYTAPADLAMPTTVTIDATASAVTSGAATASATVTIVSGVSVSISPASATVTTGQRISLAANVTGTPDGAVSWFVDGTANGNAAIGQICVAGSNPCAPPSGASAGAIDFLAPAAIPSSDPVIVTAVSRADESKSGSATITIGAPAGPVSVTLAPPYAFLPPSSSQPDTQQFYATVSGGASASVTWSLATAQGCAGGACGSINAVGLYTAPTAAPSPNAVTVTATSTADTTKSATATVIVMSGPVIETISPSSVMAGGVEGFPLAVHGVNFVAGSGAGASVILFNGTPRATTCVSAGVCEIALTPTDVTTAGTVTIEVQNPGTPSAISNPVPFVVVPFDISTGTISLTASVPVATGNDIVVTEPTTAAESSPINVQTVGPYASGSCGIQAAPVTAVRPTTGTETVSICVYGNDLDATFIYAFTGPASAPNASDIGVTASAVSGLFPGMIELDLQISSTTLRGARTLVITTPNEDRAVATGVLEVE